MCESILDSIREFDIDSQKSCGIFVALQCYYPGDPEQSPLVRRLNNMTTLTRRRFLQYGVGAGAALALPYMVQPGIAASTKNLRKYAEPLPLPGNGIVVATQHR